ncbi:MAG: hypothetical protein LBN05_08690 [Oscillospiraceae bacterium]|jgi:hypothetical protein|nr:hypothetical protein [Oscillospiraceae bacterium]
MKVKTTWPQSTEIHFQISRGKLMFFGICWGELCSPLQIRCQNLRVSLKSAGERSSPLHKIDFRGRIATKIVQKQKKCAFAHQ